jgi:hypothetical protein
LKKYCKITNPPKGAGVRQPKQRTKLKNQNENKMENQIRKTPMQELIEVIYNTRNALLTDDKFKDHEFTLSIDAMANLLNNAYSLEESILSNAFDYGFLQAELKENAEVTNGNDYVKKFYKKNENISSQV